MITRRRFVASSVAAAAAAGLAAPPALAATDPIDRLIALSVDPSGHPHIDRVAFVGLDGTSIASSHVAALPITADEARVLAEAFALRDHRRFHQAGVHVAGRHFVFLREQNDGSLLLARRDGYGLCVEETPTGLVLVQSAPGMNQGSANVALWKFTHAALA